MADQLVQNLIQQLQHSPDQLSVLLAAANAANQTDTVWTIPDENNMSESDVLHESLASPVEEEEGVIIQEETEIGHIIEFEKEIFIEEVRKYKSLWDVNSPSYKDRTSKTNAWLCISKTFNKDVDFLQRQLKNLKDNLKKCLDKRTRMTRSGAAASSLPKCKYFDQMAFLHEKTANRPSESNLPVMYTQPDIFTPPSSPIVIPKPNVATSNRKRKSDDSSDELIMKQLADMEKELKKSSEPEPECEDTHYCKSLIPILRKLPPKKNRMAKIKISQLLFELEFDEECQ